MAKKENSLRKWFSQNDGKGWVDCKTGKPCGRKKGEKRKSYPACRPTMAQCTSASKKKKSSKRINWKAKGGLVRVFQKGREMKDLSGDGKVTKKDVLIGRGVIKKMNGGMIKKGYKGGGKVKGYKNGGCVMAGRGGKYKGEM